PRSRGLVERQARGQRDPAVAAPDAELVPAAREQRELVDHRGQDERVVVREDVEHGAEVDPARAGGGHPEEPERVRRGRELREEEVLDRGVGVVAEPVGVLDLLEHLAVEPVVRLPRPALQLAVDAEPHVVTLAFSRSATERRRRGRDSSRPPVRPLGRRMSTTAIRAPRASSAVPDGTVKLQPNTSTVFVAAEKKEKSPLSASAPTTAPSRLPEPPTTSIASVMNVRSSDRPPACKGCRW